MAARKKSSEKATKATQVFGRAKLRKIVTALDYARVVVQGKGLWDKLSDEARKAQIQKTILDPLQEMRKVISKAVYRVDE